MLVVESQKTNVKLKISITGYIFQGDYPKHNTWCSCPFVIFWIFWIEITWYNTLLFQTIHSFITCAALVCPAAFTVASRNLAVNFLIVVLHFSLSVSLSLSLFVYTYTYTLCIYVFCVCVCVIILQRAVKGLGYMLYLNLRMQIGLQYIISPCKFFVENNLEVCKCLRIK